MSRVGSNYVCLVLILIDFSIKNEWKQLSTNVENANTLKRKKNDYYIHYWWPRYFLLLFLTENRLKSNNFNSGIFLRSNLCISYFWISVDVSFEKAIYV